MRGSSSSQISIEHNRDGDKIFSFARELGFTNAMSTLVLFRFRVVLETEAISVNPSRPKISRSSRFRGAPLRRVREPGG